MPNIQTNSFSLMRKGSMSSTLCSIFQRSSCYPVSWTISSKALSTRSKFFSHLKTSCHDLSVHRTKDGFKCESGSVWLSYKSLFQDVRGAVDYVHVKGSLKAKTCENLAKYIKKDPRLPQMLYNLQKSGAKTFLLTNSEWEYTDKVMHFLLDIPGSPHEGKF